MLELNEEQKKFLQENFNPEEAAAMLQTDKLDDILLPLDSLITYQGFDDDYLLNRWGSKAQRIYDEIYSQNTR